MFLGGSNNPVETLHATSLQGYWPDPNRIEVIAQIRLCRENRVKSAFNHKTFLSPNALNVLSMKVIQNTHAGSPIFAV